MDNYRRYASCIMCDLTINKEHNIDKTYELYLKMVESTRTIKNEGEK